MLVRAHAPDAPARDAHRRQLAGTTPQTQPWVSADARQAVAVWVEGGQILLSRIAFDGEPLDTSRIVSPRGVTPTAGSKYFVAWSGPRPGAALVCVTQSVDRFDVFSPTDHVVGEISASAVDESNAVIAHANQGTTAKTIMTLSVQAGMAVTTNTIAAQSPPINLHTPRIVHGDFGFAIAWTQESGASFAFVNRLDETSVRWQELQNLVNAGLAIDEDDFTAGSLSRNRWSCMGNSPRTQRLRTMMRPRSPIRAHWLPTPFHEVSCSN